MLDSITPLILTCNEEPNIGRCLERLGWAKQIVVVDSGSTDRTLEICRADGRVMVVHRPFDSFAGQCNFGLGRIRTAWALSLDADYILPEDWSAHVGPLMRDAGTATAGYRFPFRYCIHGRPLRACLYPPRTILYRTDKARYHDDGHGHRVVIDGRVVDIGLKIDHDDRKSLSRWLESQRKYAVLEAEKLCHGGTGQETGGGSKRGMADRLRRMIWPAVPATLFYTLIWKRLILDGWPGIYYSMQRAYAELLLSLELLERKLRGGGG